MKLSYDTLSTIPGDRKRAKCDAIIRPTIFLDDTDPLETDSFIGLNFRIEEATPEERALLKMIGIAD